ncbi:MAG: beta/gamma crystallin-related protein [Betaproteobacteria bacterium]
MKAPFRTGLAVAGLTLAAQAVAQVSFYENEGFQGRTFSTKTQVRDFERFGFNERASSAVVRSSRWEVCDDLRFNGSCVVLRPGRYPSLAAMGLTDGIASMRPVSASARIDDDRYAPLPIASQVVFYEKEGFQGRSFTSSKQIGNFARFGFNDRASSVDVAGEQRWEACEGTAFSGRCVILRPGRYTSLVRLGLNDRISSVRPVTANARIADDRYAPEPVAVRDGRDYRRRDSEQMHQATVTSARAVVATPEQKCWVEAAQVAPAQNTPSIPGAVVGAVLGGILGHQIGGKGSTQDIATVGGAAVGGYAGANYAKIGSKLGIGQPAPAPQNVQRCATVPSAKPDYWDVTYTFRGVDHRVQMTSQPGTTIPVNERGEPRS